MVAKTTRIQHGIDRSRFHLPPLHPSVHQQQLPKLQTGERENTSPPFSISARPFLGFPPPSTPIQRTALTHPLKNLRSSSPLSLSLSLTHYIVVVVITNILHGSAAIGSVVARFRQSAKVLLFCLLLCINGFGEDGNPFRRRAHVAVRNLTCLLFHRRRRRSDQENQIFKCDEPTCNWVLPPPFFLATPHLATFATFFVYTLVDPARVSRSVF